MKAVLWSTLVLSALLFAAVFRRRWFGGRGETEGAALFRLIQSFSYEWPFRLDTVSRIVGASLRKIDSDQYFATFMSAGSASAPIRSVELRLPTSARSKMDGILILSIDPEVRITSEAVLKHFGSEPSLSVPEPSAPYEIAYTYALWRPWVDLSFEFARGTGYLTAVVLDAVEAPLSAGGEKWLETFAAYPRARLLCSQTITGNVADILWYSYASYDAPEKVIEFYMRMEGKEAAQRDENSVIFRRGDRSLAIHRAEARDYPDCGRPPRLEEKTVLIVSSAFRPEK